METNVYSLWYQHMIRIMLLWLHHWIGFFSSVGEAYIAPKRAHLINVTDSEKLVLYGIAWTCVLSYAGI